MRQATIRVAPDQRCGAKGPFHAWWQIKFPMAPFQGTSRDKPERGTHPLQRPTPNGDEGGLMLRTLYNVDISLG